MSMTDPKPEPKTKLNWQTLREFVELVSWVAVVFAAILAVMQLYSSANADRVEATLGFVERFSGDELRQDREALTKPWLEHGEAISALNAEGGLTEEDRRVLVDGILRQASEDERFDYRGPLIGINDFFGQLMICVETKTCDAQIANEYFSSFAQRFHCLYAEQTTRLEAEIGIPNLDEGVAYFAGDEGCNSLN
jgi:hypothetical protein